MAQTVTQIFRINSTWTAPAGVTNVTVSAVIPNQGFASAMPNSASINDAALFLSAPGSVYAWGENTQGGLGNNTTISSSVPTLVIGGLNFISLATGSGTTNSSQSSYGITSAGALYAWGNNNSGQLGIGTTVSASSPTLVIGGYSWSAVIAANRCAYGLTNTGNVYSFGNNSAGQLGIGTSTSVSSPTLVIGNYLWKSISIGDADFQSVMGLTAAGIAYGWGDNTQGQLGTGNTTTASSPTLVIGGYTFQKAIVGKEGATGHGLTTTGQLYSCGRGIRGEIGNNASVSVSSPTLIVGGYVFSDFTTGAATSNATSIFAITNTGVLYGWGLNVNGQLGIGTTADVSSPTAVLGGYTWQQVVTLINANQLTGSTYGLTTSGILYSWGGNNNGELGNNTVVSASSPTAVVGGLTWQKVLGTGMGWCAALSNGNIYTWGYNAQGMLGNNSVIPTSSPVLVLAPALGSFSDTTPTVTVPVIPGASYPVIVEPTIASFSNYTIASGYVDRIVLSYAI